MLTQNNQLEILATLSSLLDQNAQLSRPFMDPVTDVIAPNYTSEIALPMNLQLILDRLGVGYYRHFQAKIFIENCAPNSQYFIIEEYITYSLRPTCCVEKM